MTTLVAQTAEVRADFIERCGTPLNRRIIDAMIASSRAKNGNLMPPGWTADDFIADTTRIARTAELFTITPEMFDLVGHAATSLPPQTLDRFDLPAMNGWLHLPSPITIDDVRGDPIAITDILWSERTLGRDGVSPGRGIPSHARGILIHAFTPTGDPSDPLWGRMDPAMLRRLVAETPKASLVHTQTVAFGRLSWALAAGDGTPQAVRDAYALASLHDGEVVEDYDDGEYLVRTQSGHTIKVRPDPFVQFLKTYFHFVKSELAAIDRENAPRSMRRWLRQLDMPMGPVSVIRLRRHAYTGTAGEGHALTYRYVRRGHWRRQWYGSGGDKYQRHIWIAPTICGPEDGPLRVRDTVNAVVR